jgi:hypothetical protein
MSSYPVTAASEVREELEPRQRGEEEERLQAQEEKASAPGRLSSDFRPPSGIDADRPSLDFQPQSAIVVQRQSATRQSATRQSATRQSATRQSATRQSATRQSATRQSATRQSATRKFTMTQYKPYLQTTFMRQARSLFKN